MTEVEQPLQIEIMTVEVGQPLQIKITEGMIAAEVRVLEEYGPLEGEPVGSSLNAAVVHEVLVEALRHARFLPKIQKSLQKAE